MFDDSSGALPWLSTSSLNASSIIAVATDTMPLAVLTFILTFISMAWEAYLRKGRDKSNSRIDQLEKDIKEIKSTILHELDEVKSRLDILILGTEVMQSGRKERDSGEGQERKKSKG